MTAPERPIGLEFICTLGMSPVEQVAVAADLGCRLIGIALEPIVSIPACPRWSLRDDADLRRRFADALRDRGVRIMLGEGFIAMPERDVAGFAADLDIMAELGVPVVNMLSADPDRARAFDQCGALAELAAARGMALTLEFLPGMPVLHDLASALAAVRHVGHAGFGVLIDTMHLFRTGGTVADVAAMAPGEIGHVQLCDVPWTSSYASYAEEARFDRRAPGDGELPLAELLAVLPADRPIGLEVPMRDKALAGIDARTRLADALAKARALVATA